MPRGPDLNGWACSGSEGEAEQGWVEAVLRLAGHAVAGRLGIGLAVVETEYAIARRLEWECCG